MVYNYDIYLRHGPRSSHVYRITNDAVPGVIYNGVPDWLYEGEYKKNAAVNWKRNGKKDPNNLNNSIK